jgi:arylsulfatase A-like enzyme
MKVMFILFDSLNRNALGAYGGKGINTPNFDRFAERSVRFDNHYVGSMPCMPARRELHTGRSNFLHRSWGPLEPFDNSMALQLRDHDVHSHMITDHAHYWMNGGATYHTQYSSFEFIRGQEKDPWKVMVQPPVERYRDMYHPGQFNGKDRRYLPYIINREHTKNEDELPLAGCMQSTFNFLDDNHDKDNWFLHLECFDPHEPFWVPERFKRRRDSGYRGPILDWPRYEKVSESAEEVAELQNNYAGNVEMCDEYFGRLLDYFDENDMWSDTAIILTTDHGFLLGEHDWWAKNIAPYYNNVAHIPLMIYHPDFKNNGGSSRKALTQTMDIMPTILNMFDEPVPDNVEGQNLIPILGEDRQGHEAVLYGIFGGAVNITDGRYTYFRYPVDMAAQELYEYTLMPTHLEEFFSREELLQTTLSEPMDYADGLKLLKIPARKDSDGTTNVPPFGAACETETVLYDLAIDPGQLHPINNPEVIERFEKQMTDMFRRNNAPGEAYRRVGLEADST